MRRSYDTSDTTFLKKGGVTLTMAVDLQFAAAFRGTG
jgi:hypothetical protein